MFYEAYDLFDKGRYHECLPMFNEISNTSNDTRFMYWSLIFSGRCKMIIGGEGVLEDFLKASSIFPERAEALCDLGNYYYTTGNFQDAMKVLRQAYMCKPKDVTCIRYEQEKYFEYPHEMMIDICMSVSRFNDSEELLASLIMNGNRSLYDTKKAEHNYLYSRHFNNAFLEFAKAKTIETNDTLIIELPDGYDGLGDNFVFSHIPRIAKESGKFSTVLVSNKNKYKGEGYADIVWATNPYVDGFTDLPGTYSSVQMNRALDKWNNLQPSLNIMDSIMLLHNLDDGKRGHVPECYYEPNFIEDVRECVILDAGSKTIDLNMINGNSLMGTLNANGIFPDSIIKTKGSTKSIPISGLKEISPSSIREWADIIFSAKTYVCFNSGGYWLSGALGVRVKHIWIERKNLPSWSYLDHDNIRISLSTIYQGGTLNQ